MNITAQPVSNEHIVHLLRSLKNELHCSSTRKVITHVRLILSQLKNFMTPDLVVKMPPLFHLVLPAHSVSRATQQQISHLDELADSLHAGSKIRKHLYRSEVEALTITIVVLKHMQKLFKRTGIEVLPYVLTQELHQAVIEEAA